MRRTDTVSAALACLGLALVAGIGATWPGARAVASEIEAPGPAAAPLLRPLIELDDPAIRLGDIFDNAGRYADRAVASAPEPGETVVLEAAWLWRIANAYGLDWRPASKFDTARVHRLSTRIPASTQADLLLRAAIDAAMADPDLTELSFDAPLQDINLPTGMAATLRLDRWSYDPISRRFTATLAAPAEGAARRMVTVAGSVDAMALVPVPMRRIAQGDVVGPSDLDWQRVRADRVPRGAGREEEAVLGMAARRVLMPGTLIREQDVAPPVLVERRANVIVVLETGDMTLTMQGRALDAGALGDQVRVENLQSKRIVEGVVDGPGKVRVALPQILALR